MRLLLASLFITLPGWAVLTPTSVDCAGGGGAASVNFTGVNGIATHGPLPFSCPVVLTGTGTATASTGGANFAWVDPVGMGVSSGLTAGTYYLQLSGAWSSSVAGTFVDSTHVVIAGVTLTVTVQVQNRFAIPIYVNALGVLDASLSGCSAPTEASWMSGCSNANGRPGGTFTLPSVVGNTYVDAKFGTSVRYVAPYDLQYTSLNLISPDNVYLLSNYGEAAAGVYRVNGSGKIGEHPRTFNTNEVNCGWIPKSSNKGYCIGFYGSQYIYCWHVDGGGTHDDGICWTEPHGLNIGDGGKMAPTATGWKGFLTQNRHYAWAVNLNNTSQTATFDLSTGGVNLDTDPASNNGPRVIGPDYLNKYYFVIVPDSNYNMYKGNRNFSWTPGDITMAYTGMGPPNFEYGSRAWINGCNPTNSQIVGNCFPSVGLHGAAVSAGGHAYVLMLCERNYPNYFGALCAMDMSAGLPNMAHAAAVGGGQFFLTTNADHNGGAANSPFIVVMKANDGGTGANQGYQYDICTATGVGATVTLTFCDEDPAWATGTDILIGGALGKPGINDVHTVTRIGATNQYIITVSDVGTYTARTGAAVKNAALGQLNQEIDVIHMTPTGADAIIRLAQTQSPIYASFGGEIGYKYYPWVTISEDGAIVCWSSSGGIPFGSASPLTGNIKTFCAANPLAIPVQITFEGNIRFEGNITVQ